MPTTMSKGGLNLTFVPNRAPLSKVNIDGKEVPAAVEDSPVWLTCPAEGLPPMTVKALSEESKPPTALGRVTKEQQIIDALADMVNNMSNKEKKRAPKAKRKLKRTKLKPPKRNGSPLVVKGLSPPLHLKTCNHRMPLGDLGLRAVKPDWMLFRKQSSSGAGSSGRPEEPAKKKHPCGYNPSLEVRALSDYPDPYGAPTAVVNNTCNARKSLIFRESARYKPLIINTTQKTKQKKMGSKTGKSSKVKRKPKKTFDMLLQDRYCAIGSMKISGRTRPYTCM